MYTFSFVTLHLNSAVSHAAVKCMELLMLTYVKVIKSTMNTMISTFLWAVV